MKTGPFGNLRSCPYYLDSALPCGICPMTMSILGLFSLTCVSNKRIDALVSVCDAVTLGVCCCSLHLLSSSKRD